METTTRRVVYRGNPALASLLIHTLKQGGVRVKWERARDERGWQDAAEGLVVNIVARGGNEAIKAAVVTFRERANGHAEATIEGDDDGEDA